MSSSSSSTTERTPEQWARMVAAKAIFTFGLTSADPRCDDLCNCLTEVESVMKDESLLDKAYLKVAEAMKDSGNFSDVLSFEENKIPKLRRDVGVDRLVEFVKNVDEQFDAACEKKKDADSAENAEKQ